ncbi:MAG: glycerophosphodiester phosphodiesterase family protein [Pseudomonadota bacterium]
MPPPNTADPGRIIAHRGASRTAPENTLAAFREAARQGVRWIEFDVSLLGDRQPVVHHDATIDRCSTSQGSLTHLRAADLAGIDMGSRHSAIYAGEPLPSLDQALDLIDRLEIFANLEIKPHDDPAEDLAEIVARALAERDWALDRVLVSSFSEPVLAAFRQRAPGQPIALLQSSPSPDWVARAKALSAAALHLDYRHLSETVLREARLAGLDLRVYTINNPDVVAPFREIGLTGVITDHPPLFLDAPGWAEWAGLDARA